MKKVNTKTLATESWQSPDDKFMLTGIEISEALGRDPKSADPNERHPFDVEIQRIPAGAQATYLHSHSAQWEFYHVISGSGRVRHDGGSEAIEAGDAFLFKPGEAHQLIAGDEDLVVYVVADNPNDDRGTILESA